jgi:hypothetical protein
MVDHARKLQDDWAESVRRGREAGGRCVCGKNPQTGRCGVHERDPNKDGWENVSAEVRQRIWGDERSEEPKNPACECTNGHVRSSTCKVHGYGYP